MPETDLRSGAETSEYRLSLLTLLMTLGGSFLLSALVLVALIFKAIDLTATLILLGIVLSPAVPSAAVVARGFARDRRDLKVAKTEGDAKVEAARLTAAGPATPGGMVVVQEAEKP